MACLVQMSVLGACKFGELVQKSVIRADCFMAATNACVLPSTIKTTVILNMVFGSNHKRNPTRLHKVDVNEFKNQQIHRFAAKRKLKQIVTKQTKTAALSSINCTK